MDNIAAGGTPPQTMDRGLTAKRARRTIANLTFSFCMQRKNNAAAYWVFGAIMAAVLAWGILHAVGAYRLNHNPWRPLVVVGCSLGFVLFWIAMLAISRSRHRSE